MYIWVVLATFLAMLASYSLSIRSDMREVTIEPIAEAALGMFISQHEGAYQYVKYKKYPYTAGRKIVNYTPGVIAENDIINEMPKGYNLNGSYTSQIFCMNPAMTEAYSNQAACNDKKNQKMLITYGPVPFKWANLYDYRQLPNKDFMSAMRRIVNAGENLGYTAPAETDDISECQANPNPSPENTSCSSVKLMGRKGGMMVFIPEAVLNDGIFKSICDPSGQVSCLVYMTSI